MSEYVYAGSTSQTIDIFLQDSSSTTGAGLAGLVFNSAGLVASYRKGATGSRVAITLATQTVGGAYSSGGFVEIEATHMKGVYRFDIPDAAIDTAGFITLYFYGATNLLATSLRVDCRALPANVKQISDDSVAADNAEAFFDGTGYAGTNNVIPTVTTLTNLPAITANWLTAAGIAPDAGEELAALVETYIVNEGDATAVMQAIANLIAADWVAGDASPLAIAAAVRTNLATELARIDVANSTLSTQTSVDAVAVQLVDILSLVESVALTGAATYVAATSSTLTTGTLSSGTFADTFTADGVSHVHTDAAGAIEVIYDYEMGASAVAVEALFRGRVTSSNDTILVQAYDWIGADWETIWSQAGTNGSVATDRAEPLLAKHTGTGANDGKVRIRFYAASGLSSATLYVDQLLIAKTVTQVDLTAGALANIVTQLGTGSTLTSLATAANLTALKTVADKIATVIYGTVTGAGTATEVFVSAGYTVTVTVDASGNRSAVVIT